MSKHLVIVESPAKAKTISQYLGSDYHILASYGHVRDLPERTLGIDIKAGLNNKSQFTPQYSIMKDKQKVIKQLRDASKTAPTVYLATDPDREGEAIAWHIKESLKVPAHKIRRVVFHEITKTAVQHAIGNARDINTHLVDAQQARRVLDRLIGYKLSPILSKKIRKGLSAGRVQSVAVKLICDRETAIRAFVAEEYWVVTVSLDKNQQPIQAKLVAEGTPDAKCELPNESVATGMVSRLESSEYAVHSVKKTKQKRNPYPPFITSTLQQDASRKLNWSAKKTMMVAQKLYEGVPIGNDTVGLITYMRTDSFRVSDEALAAVREHITTTYGSNYLPASPNRYKTKGDAQDAHEAIRPTYLTRSPDTIRSALTPDFYKLYRLIWDRFVASQMKPSDIENTSVMIEATSSTHPPLYVKATGHVVLFDGFTAVYVEGKDQEDEENAKRLPPLSEKDALALIAVTPQQKFTQPPSRYTEATLVKELEESGIGRPSTYAPTLSTIVDRGYVDKEKKTLFPTDLGMLTNTKLQEFFSGVIDVRFTADMETRLDEIMEGKHVWEDVVGDIYTPFYSMLSKAQNEMEKVNTDQATDEICPKCSSPMVIKTGRFGTFIACTNYPDCKTTRSMAAKLAVPCPLCGSDVLERKSKKGNVFYGCSTYPTCTFASWDRLVPGPCRSCQHSYLVVKKGKGRDQTICPTCHTPAE